MKKKGRTVHRMAGKRTKAFAHYPVVGVFIN